MAEKRDIKMTVLWPFVGPEGATEEKPEGRVRKGDKITTSRDRAFMLARHGMAEFDDQPKESGPSQTQDRSPGEIKDVEFDLETASIREILEKVDGGGLMPQEVLDAEVARETQRSTLVDALRQRLKAGG